MHELRIVDAADLACAYAAAEYSVMAGERRHGIRVGARATELESDWPANHYAFITAWNPASAPRLQTDNERADRQLCDRLDDLGVLRAAAWSQAPDGSWREPGWVVADLPRETLDALARQLGQAGTLSWARGEPVRLRMMVARPRHASEAMPVDWVE